MEEYADDNSGGDVESKKQDNLYTTRKSLNGNQF